MKQIYVLVLIFGFFQEIALTQNSINLFRNPATRFAKFDSITGVESSGLINGRVYIPEYIDAQLHPFWQGRAWKKSNLNYQGQYYPGVEVLYDAFQDQLIYNYKDQRGLSVWMLLYPEEISDFTLDNAQFERIIPDNPQGVASGFYEVVFQGEKIKLLAKRIKEKYIDNQTILFRKRSRYYLLTKDKYRLIDSKKDFTSIFPANDTQVKSFIKKNKLKVNSRNEDDLIRLSEYCDRLEH